MKYQHVESSRKRPTRDNFPADGGNKHASCGEANFSVVKPVDIAAQGERKLPRGSVPLATTALGVPLMFSSGGSHGPHGRVQEYAGPVAKPRSANMGAVLAKVFGFQSESVRNQRDNAISMLASRLSRAVGREGKQFEVLVTRKDTFSVLEWYRGEILSNYNRWCSFLGATPISLEALFDPPRGDKTAAQCAHATETALMLLIWGEAGNLRLCPEFLCFLFHKMSLRFREAIGANSVGLEIPRSFLDDVITPAYKLLKKELDDIGDKPIDHSTVCNYDDFNEIFWQQSCIKDLEYHTMFDSDNPPLKKRFKKTFVERQSWLVPIFHFWRVYALHIMGLHLMIVGARCQEDLGACNAAEWGSTVITLYGCSVVRDVWDILRSAEVSLGNRGRFGQAFLNLIRGVVKGLITFILFVMYWADADFFPFAAALFLILAAAGEAVMITELWWGIASYGKWGAATERNCAGGGFASCMPSWFRQLGWSVVGSMAGINSVNLYTQVHSLPPIHKRVAYVGFWGIVLANKILFSYFVVIKKMTVATYTLYNADPTEYEFGPLLGKLVDSHNYLYIVALWLGSGLIYFLDMQIWFVVWANIAAACEGVRRRVGELNSGDQVVKEFNRLHKVFFDYLGMKDETKHSKHTRFAHVWNEIVDAMRKEDILSDKERLQLRYFLIKLRLPTAEGTHRNQPVDVQAGEWGPLFTLMPEFLISGAVQRAVQSASDFRTTNKDLIKDINEGKEKDKLVNLGKLAEKQYDFVKEQEDDKMVKVTEEMVRQLSATTFFLLDALCRSDELSRSLWNLYRELFRGDVGKGDGDSKGDKIISKAADFSKDSNNKHYLLFSVQNFPGFVDGMIGLVKALNKHLPSLELYADVSDATLKSNLKKMESSWKKDVAVNLETMIKALLQLLYTETREMDVAGMEGSRRFLKLLKDVRENLTAWSKAFFPPQDEKEREKEVKAKGWPDVPGAQHLKESAEKLRLGFFLRRTQVFLESESNSEPGLIAGKEARRRIIFFVNSLFVDQPKRKEIVKMPSLTTLTPYYNEEVVMSVEDLRKETQDGVTVLEYLRSIYHDEFDHFVERMAAVSSDTIEDYKFGLNVMKPLLDVLLDTSLGTEVKRESLLQRVENGIIADVQKRRRDSNKPELRGEEFEKLKKAVKYADVDEKILQLQMWASHRHQTLARTVRGMMYYSQAVRLLAAVENMEEFQPKNTGDNFGSSDKPTKEDSRDVVDDVNAAHSQHQRQQQWHGTNLPQPAPAVSDARGSFRKFFDRAKQGGVEEEKNIDKVLAVFDEDDDLEAGARAAGNNGRSRAAPIAATRAPPVSPRTSHDPQPRSSSEGSSMYPIDTKNARFKAIERKASEASRRENEAAARRGWQRKAKQADSKDLYFQVQDPALDTDCVEYRKTTDLAEAKYMYVVSCQIFGQMLNPDPAWTEKKKVEFKAKAAQIKMLAREFPSLRIAYVDKVPVKDQKDEAQRNMKGNGDVDQKNEKEKHEFFSVLCKNAGDGTDQMEEEYRVKLPGDILVGEGKPNNQNHAIIFTRGEAIQAIDMNQDAALEDAIKIRQVMEEFNFAKDGFGRGDNIGRIVGFREHVFTHDVSAVANFFSLQELNFVAATQRALDNPLHVRFHYGHPDVFDRVSAITMGGISKASKGIHLSEDIFAGFNYVLRGGEATQADYIQVSKGRDTGVAQVTGFTAKISMGNGMQARSREVGRLASQFDIFRLLSFYYSSVGGFMNQVLLMVAVYLYVYAKLYIAFDPDFENTVDDEVLEAISSQFLFQLGFLLILPIPLLLAVEQGIRRAISTLFNIMLRLAPFFFIFSAGTNAFYVNSAVMTGEADYKATGRGFVIAHEDFVTMFPRYLASHFNPAFELLVVLVVYASFATSGYFLETFSVYLLVIGLLWTPLVFNPNGLDFTYASQDFSGWLEWMDSSVNDPKKGWQSWYRKVLDKTRENLPWDKKLQAVFRRSRLLVLVFGFLTAIGEDYPGGVDGDVWWGNAVVGSAMLIIVAVLMCGELIVDWISKKLNKTFDSRWHRLLRLFAMVGVLIAALVLASYDILESIRQFFFYILSFVILIYWASQTVVLFKKDALKDIWLVRVAFKSVHLMIGMVIMLPVLLLSFLPLFVDLQTRMLFSEDFSQRFSIAKIFARQNNRTKIKTDVEKKNN